MLTYQFLDNLYSSTSILLHGFFTASGNLFRQTAEGMALSVLCPLDYKIKRKINKNKFQVFNFYECFKIKKKFTYAHNAIKLLEQNQDDIGITHVKFKHNELL